MIFSLLIITLLAYSEEQHLGILDTKNGLYDFFFAALKFGRNTAEKHLYLYFHCLHNHQHKN